VDRSHLWIQAERYALVHRISSNFKNISIRAMLIVTSAPFPDRAMIRSKIGTQKWATQPALIIGYKQKGPQNPWGKIQYGL